jgi:nucleoid DNA-binding protein
MNERLNIQDLAAQIAAETGKDKETIETFLRNLVLAVSDALSEDKIVKVKGIGTFKVLLAEKRESVHVNTGERFVIPEHYKFSFLPDKEMKDAINQPFSAFETTEITNDALLADLDLKEEESDKEEDEDSEESTSLFEEREEVASVPIESTQPEETSVQPTTLIHKANEPLPTPSEPEPLQTEPEKMEPSAVPNETLNNQKPAEPEPVKPCAVTVPIHETLIAEEEKRSEEYKERFKKIQNQLASEKENYHRMRNWMTIITVLFALTALASVLCCVWLFNQNRQLKNVLFTASSPTPVVLAPVDSVAQKDTTQTTDTIQATQMKAKATEPEILGEEEIRPGINLARLAKKYYGNSVFWVYLYQFNSEKLGDPNNVPIGTKIKIPSKGHYQIDAGSKESLKAASALQTQILTKYQ